MVELITLALMDTRAPRPSIETLLHAFIPLDWIDHSHADAILTLTNQADARRVCKRFSAMPLAWSHILNPDSNSRGRRPMCLTPIRRRRPSSRPACLVTFGESAQQSYERHIELVSRAEARIRRSWFGPRQPTAQSKSDAASLALTLRGPAEPSSTHDCPFGYQSQGSRLR